MRVPAEDAAVLSVAEMVAADRAAMAGGVSGPRLMAAAGHAVALAVRRRWSRRPVAILCGPGNNGGDGFVAARLLAARGWPVRVALLGRRESLTGDAAWAAGRWRDRAGRPGAVESLTPGVLDGCGLVIDALFGAGLSRPVDGIARAVVEETNRRGLPCVAVDVPSGIDGDTGQAMGGVAARADVTVTFFRPKPAHLLLPGRLACGEVVVADIGIPDSVLAGIGPATFANGPALWQVPRPGPMGHKYDRGHAVVIGGPVMTGAGRLAARAARRVGAGLLTVAAPPASMALYAADAPGVIVAPVESPEALAALLADPRRNAILVGPGAGTGASTRAAVETALATGRACVVDADGLTCFRGDPAALAAAIRGPVVLTPHDGEFAALFPRLAGAGSGARSGVSRLVRARAAAAESGAVVLLKGGDTVIAAPDGRAAINSGAPPDLATAGAGDVLAGIILGLLAQGMEAFDAACAGAWLHGESATRVGRGLLAEDLPEALPAVLARVESWADRR